MTARYLVKRTPSFEAADVYDRATGRRLGSVCQHEEDGGRHGLQWSVHAPWVPASHVDQWNLALGSYPEPTRHEAIAALYDPAELRPEYRRRRCKACRPKLWGHPCDDCETPAEAEARARRECPEWWDHHDWLASLEAAP